ncbi:Transmembrane protein [Apiospora kogelbergensis]|uniref:Transmembrane protein n=1 Tax=Apiospora kogelbergensis TaxID=1337665 RepID=A0AAW0QH68_9PEZI
MDSTHLHQLVGRLFDKDKEEKPEPYNYTASNGQLCPMPRPLLVTDMAPVVGNITFHQLNVYITAGCAAFTTLSILVLMARHATHLSRPNEQLNILRICGYLPLFSVGLFLEAAFPDAYPYLTPWLDVFQAIALANFFLLMCQFVSPSDAHRDAFFAVFEVPAKKLFKGRGNSEGKNKKTGLEWYRGLWWSIFQYPVVQILVSIFTSITEAATVYCLPSSSPHFAHLWMDIAHNVSLAVAVIAALRIYSALKKQLAHHRPLAKLLAFKLVVGVTGLIQLVYWILRSSVVQKKFVLEPTDTLSWADEFVGIPVLILALVCVPFSVFFHHAYSVSPYYLDRASQNKPLAYSAAYDMEAAEGPHAAVNPVGSRYQGGPLGVWAWAGIFNPSEFIAGLRFGMQMRSNSRRRQDMAYEENAPLATLPAYRSSQNSPQPPHAYVR